jgi:ferredoxin
VAEGDSGLVAAARARAGICRISRGVAGWNRTGRLSLRTMRIVVDLNRCQGYGQCAFLAPEVFDLRGEEALMYNPGPDEAQRLPVLRAAAACPVQAIRVETRNRE